MSTLAAISDYVFGWQLPFIGLYLLIWLAGWPYLTRHFLKRAGDLPRSKTTLGRSAIINLFSNVPAFAAVVVIFTLCKLLAVNLGFWVFAPGVVVASAAMLGMALVVNLTMLQLPARRVAAFTLRTTGLLLLAAILLFGGMAYPSHVSRFAKLDRDLCSNNLHYIRAGLNNYARRSPGRPPATLEALQTADMVKPEHLRCPGRRDGTVGFLYVPTPPVDPRARSSSGGTTAPRPLSKITVCDRRGNHGSQRHVLYANGRIELVNEKRFDELLKLPENAGMAQLVLSDK